ncbi:amidase family protein [Streptomyces rectiviolaceus]|uniref:amidase family protein n=1 Tax=Streptomyces rectiviolaceus TaxID=332591 RepID=UPI0036DD26A6
MAGRRTELGSRLAAGAVAGADSSLTLRFRRAGLVTFGRTATPEMAYSITTEPVLYGATRSPWNLERSAGGSSGGAGAAVAAGVVPIAHATDAAGSLRIPAAHNGLFGLKPTRGRVSMGPDIDEIFNGLAVHGSVSRTVRDSAALLDQIRGPEPGDPYFVPEPSRSRPGAVPAVRGGSHPPPGHAADRRPHPGMGRTPHHHTGGRGSLLYGASARIPRPPGGGGQGRPRGRPAGVRPGQRPSDDGESHGLGSTTLPELPMPLGAYGEGGRGGAGRPRLGRTPQRPLAVHHGVQCRGHARDASPWSERTPTVCAGNHTGRCDAGQQRAAAERSRPGTFLHDKKSQLKE